MRLPTPACSLPDVGMVVAHGNGIAGPGVRSRRRGAACGVFDATAPVTAFQSGPSAHLIAAAARCSTPRWLWRPEAARRPASRRCQVAPDCAGLAGVACSRRRVIIVVCRGFAGYRCGFSPARPLIHQHEGTPHVDPAPGAQSSLHSCVCAIGAVPIAAMAADRTALGATRVRNLEVVAGVPAGHTSASAARCWCSPKITKAGLGIGVAVR